MENNLNDIRIKISNITHDIEQYEQKQYSGMPLCDVELVHLSSQKQMLKRLKNFEANLLSQSK